MAVCQYFLRGQCKFGSDCRNEHPQGGRAQGGGFGNSSWTRPGGGGTGSTATTKLFSVQSIETDMNPAVDKPSWPLSSYAPAKYEPLLLPGLDQSFEELRVKATTALKEGKSNEYTQYEASTIAAAEQVFANLRANLTQAYEQALRQTAGSDPTPAPATSAFGTAASSTAFPSTSSAFGTTSVFGNNNAKPATSVFGTPGPAGSAFGAAAPATSVFGTPAPTASAFGQPAPATSTFGTPAPATSAFGTPAPATSAFGTPAPATSAFGQTGFGTTPASTSAFGGGATTSAFGKPAFGQPAFGQTSTPSAPATGAFGQPLNNPTTTPAAPSAFGAPAATTTTSAFGQPAFGQSSLIKPASGAFSAFSGGGANPFAAAAAANNPTPATTTGTTGGGGGAFSAFSGQPSAFGLGATGTTTQNVFGQPAFGQPSAPAAPATSVFGTPAPAASAFGAPAQTTSVFGQPQQPAQTTSVFGQPAAVAPTSVFGGTGWGGGLTANAASASTPSRVQSTTMEMNPSSASSNTPMKTAVSMGSSSSGAAGFGKPGALDFNTMKNAGVKPGMNPYDQMLPPNYAEMLPAGVLDAFKAPSFEWGNVPDWVPPLSVR